MKSIGDNIKKIRDLRNITREYIADELGMSLSNYSKIERGEIDFTISRLFQISEILNVDVKQILDFNSNHIFNLPEGTDANTENVYIRIDDYKDKYIKLLEEKVERLKK